MKQREEIELIDLDQVEGGVSEAPTRGLSVDDFLQELRGPAPITASEMREATRDLEQASRLPDTNGYLTFTYPQRFNVRGAQSGRIQSSTPNVASSDIQWWGEPEPPSALPERPSSSYAVDEEYEPRPILSDNDIPF